MTNRKQLYGYCIRNGERTIVPEEAGTVSRVFTLYTQGLSYQAIADTLNGERIPYSLEVPLWDRHKIKRMLENPRYMGQNGYPPVIDAELFQKVQHCIQAKTAGYAPKEDRPALKLMGCLRCAHCGGSFRRLAGKNRRTDTLYLKCGGCGAVITISDSGLLSETARQVAQHDAPVQEPYRPSGEVVRLTNAINRELERPSEPEEAVSLILRCAAARYDCCPGPISQEDHDRLPDQDHIRQTVSHITISTENTITVHFN